jgi:hypothetical protein
VNILSPTHGKQGMPSAASVGEIKRFTLIEKLADACQ